MNFVSGLLLYVSLWWVVIFMVLPLGVRQDRNPPKGGAPGAPQKSDIKKKLFWTTVLTTLLWGALYGLMAYNQVTLRTLIRGEDSPPWVDRAPSPSPLPAL